MKIYTSRYNNKALADWPGVKVGITVGYPRFKLAYPMIYVKELGPDRSYLNKSREEYTPLYLQHLDMLGAQNILARLQKISDEAGGGDVVLLCFEDLRTPGEWCHRRLLADWLQEQTGTIVEELEETTPAKGGPKLDQPRLFADPWAPPTQMQFA